MRTDGRHALRAPHERLGRADVDDREGPDAAVDDHGRGGARPGTRPRPRCATSSTGAPASSPACASGSGSNPLSIAPPRWEVDPNFDLDFHLRFVRAGGDRSVRSVLDLAEPIAMQGFDRARPLWEITVVEGLEDDQAALILKVHHAITDGVGAVQDRARHVRARAGDRRARRHARAPPRPRSWARSGGSGTRSTTSAGATSGSPMRSAGTVVGGLPIGARRPGRDGRAGRRDRGVRGPHGRTGDRTALTAHDRAVAVGPLRHVERRPARGEGRRQAGGRHAQRRVRGRDRGRLPPLPRGAWAPKPTACA